MEATTTYNSTQMEILHDKMTKEQMNLVKDMKLNLPIQVTVSNDDFKIFTRSECPDKKMHKCGIAKAYYSL